MKKLGTFWVSKWWKMLCRRLWEILLFFWLTIIFGLILNILANWLTTRNFDPKGTPLGWLEQHLFMTIILGIGLCILTLSSGLLNYKIKLLQQNLSNFTQVEALERLQLKALSKFPHIWNVPYHRNTIFTGQEIILKTISETFQNSTFSQPQALTGLGGIGKTQIAVEYAYRYCQQYAVVLWVEASTYNTLVSGFIAIATLLDLPEQGLRDQMVIVNTVTQWLRSNKNWLLILDNIEDLKVVYEFLPTIYEGDILLTTRIHALGQVAHRIEIKCMSPEIGSLFLLRRCSLSNQKAHFDQSSYSDRVMAQAISKELGGLPLALDQAGAYIEETQCSLSNYLQQYRIRCLALLKRRGGIAMTHYDSFATTWLLAFEKVEQQNPVAADLLRVCAFLHPEAIPEELITKGAIHLGPLLNTLPHSPAMLDDAIMSLGTYSLIYRDTKKQTFNVHRLVQTMLRDTMDQKSQLMWLERVTYALNEVFFKENTNDVNELEIYLPHLEILIKEIGQSKCPISNIMLLIQKADDYLSSRSRYAEIETLLTNVLVAEEKQPEPNSENIILILIRLGRSHRNQGRLELAITMYQRALRMCDDTKDCEYDYTHQILNNLGAAFRDQGKYYQSEQLLQRAIGICEQVVGHKHSRTAHVLDSLGLVCRHQCKYKQAENLFQQAISIYAQLDTETFLTGQTLSNLGNLYREVGKYYEAKLNFQQALTIYEKTLGEGHANVGHTLRSLGMLYREYGKFEQAEPLLLRALTIHERVLGSNHYHTAFASSNLGLLYRDQGKLKQAEALLLGAVTIYEQILEPDHPFYVVLSLLGLGLLYQDQDKLEQAEQIFLRALDICEKKLSPHHLYLSISLNHIAAIHCRRGKYEQAESLLQQALNIQQELLEPTHPQLMKTLETQASLYKQTQKKEEAAELEKQINAIRSTYRSLN